jgi:hypothetical protein
MYSYEYFQTFPLNGVDIAPTSEVKKTVHFTFKTRELEEFLQKSIVRKETGGEC